MDRHVFTITLLYRVASALFTSSLPSTQTPGVQTHRCLYRLQFCLSPKCPAVDIMLLCCCLLFLMTACFGGSSISFSDSKTNLFKLPNNIPLYGLILSLSIDQLKDMSIASNLYQLWEKPCYKYLYAAFCLGIHFHLIFVDSK